MTNDTIRSEADDYLAVNGILDNLKKYTQTPWEKSVLVCSDVEAGKLSLEEVYILYFCCLLRTISYKTISKASTNQVSGVLQELVITSFLDG